MSKVLIVDDDRNLLEVLKYNLQAEKCEVIEAQSGEEAIEKARNEKPDLIILDVMLPGLDGFEVCRIMRKETGIPIIMLTAKSDEMDRIIGLEVGADGYMTKPFSVKELVARVRATLRRSSWVKPASPQLNPTAQQVVKVGNLEIDMVGHTIFRDKVEIRLTPKEFDLLSFLINHLGVVFNRDELLSKIWGHNFEGTPRTIDVHVRSIRKKIEDNPESPTHLLTVHGYGYKLD